MKITISILAAILSYGFCAISQATPIQWGGASGNGHHYDVVPVADRVTWETARDDAAVSIFHGIPGYLATITSQAEQDFIVN